MSKTIDNKRKLKSAGFYYKNDTPNGIGVILFNNKMKYLNKIKETIQNEFDNKKNTENPNYFLEQLNYFCQKKLVHGEESLTEENRLLLVMDIIFLSNWWLIPNDEFNGCVYSYE